MNDGSRLFGFNTTRISSIFLCALLLLICMPGCSDDDDSSSGGVKNFKDINCAEVGGTVMTYGACIFTDEEACKRFGGTVYGSESWTGHGAVYCHPKLEKKDNMQCEDIPGWMNAGDSWSYACEVKCEADSDCPSGEGCKSTTTGKHCLKKSSSGSGDTDPCSGCGGIFCSGKCSICPACH